VIEKVSLINILGSDEFRKDGKKDGNHHLGFRNRSALS
jgi:hypothetical protein